MTIELKPGDEAPSFEAQDAGGTTWNLDELRGKRVVLYFYPADFTPG
jgi:peroxiredoxin Q/BCP